MTLPNDILEKTKNRDIVLLLEDQANDLNMVNIGNHASVITVGFLISDSSNDAMAFNFVIVSEELDDYYDVKKMMFKSDNK